MNIRGHDKDYYLWHKADYEIMYVIFLVQKRHLIQLN